MQQFKYFLASVLALILFSLLIASIIIGRSVIATAAPFIVWLLIGALAVSVLAITYMIIAGLAGFTLHFVRKGKLEGERYHFQTYRLDPVGANYPVIFDPDTKQMIQAQPGILSQAVPHTLTYSPHFSRTYEGVQGEEEEEQEILSQPLPRAQPFYSIIEEVRPGHLCLGVAASGPLFGTMDDLLSTAIVGRPGTGKTTLLRFVCAQVLRIGGTPLMWDPHGNIADELSTMLECSETQRAIDASSKRLERMLEQRLHERRNGKRDFPITLQLADEWPVISALCPQAITTIKRVVLEGRKVGMYALISGQGIPAALLDGTLVRDALSSRYVFHTTPQQARLAGLDSETAKELLAVLDTTGPGRAILASSRLKPEVIAVPHTTVNDIRLCMGKETDVSAHETALQAISEDLLENRNLSEQKALASADMLSVGNETRAIIKRMRKKGMPHREIAQLVGLAGDKYKTYRALCQQEGIDIETSA